MTEWPAGGWASSSFPPSCHAQPTPSLLNLEVTSCEGLVNLVPSSEHTLPKFDISVCVPNTGDTSVASLSNKQARFRGVHIDTSTRWPTVQIEIQDNSGRVLGTARLTIDASSTHRHCTTLRVRPRYRDASTAKLCIEYNLRRRRKCHVSRPTIIRRTTLVRVAPPRYVTTRPSCDSFCDCNCGHTCW